MTGRLASVRSPWTVGRRLKQPPLVRLYCFPHSGGLPSEYVRWDRELPGVQVYGICPPGRGPRVSEPSLTRLPELVTALLDETEFEPPFVFFGHSLGALVAFETARALRARGRALPQRLIVSAHAAPGTHLGRAPWHALPDDELIRLLNESYDSVPEHVSADPHLMAMSLKAIRSDFALLDAHRPRAEDPLAVPIDAFYGEADTVSLSAIEQWRHHTTRAFRKHRFPGGHFYFRHADIFDVLGPLIQAAAAEDRPPWSPRTEGVQL
ncbi:thioesterase II family protein [Streptomyces spectabilis]|nr:alpha/beta fold hydrolase [Streptomyces spectabilis]